MNRCGGFSQELDKWRDFCIFQRDVRTDCLARNCLSLYQQTVRELRRAYGHDDDVELLEDASKQTRLQNWVEYQYDQYELLGRLVREIEQSNEQIASVCRKFENAGMECEDWLEPKEAGGRVPENSPG